MPYFKTKGGGKGYTNDEGVMAYLEGLGYIRLKGRELFFHIVWRALKKWGLPAIAAVAIYHYTTGEFMVALLIFAFVQKILDR